MLFLESIVQHSCNAEIVEQAFPVGWYVCKGCLGAACLCTAHLRLGGCFPTAALWPAATVQRLELLLPVLVERPHANWTLIWHQSSCQSPITRQKPNILANMQSGRRPISEYLHTDETFAGFDDGTRKKNKQTTSQSRSINYKYIYQ